MFPRRDKNDRRDILFRPLYERSKRKEKILLKVISYVSFVFSAERGSRNGAKYRRRVFLSENSRGRKREGREIR